MTKRITAILAAALLALCLCACELRPIEVETPSPAPESSAPQTPDEDLTVEMLSGVMTADEIAALDRYPNLKTLDLSGSECYDAIMRYIAAHPGVKVTYTVDIGGTVIDGDAEDIDLSGAEFTPELLFARASCLPKLKSILLDGEKCSSEDIELLRSGLPQIDIDYTVSILGRRYPHDIAELDLSDITEMQVEDAAAELKKLDCLERVKLTGEDGTGTLTLVAASRLMDAVPEAVFDYTLTLFGQQISTADERVEFIDTEIGNDGLSEIRTVLPYMRALDYLKLDGCGVDSEHMAQLRDEYPDIKVVWRVYFSAYGEGPVGFVSYNCLTDTEKIWATGCVSDQFAKELQYCTDVKYLDLGHNCITNIDFVRNMPKLEVAILAITWVESIEPLKYCPELEYLEIFSSHVTDITPLASCTKLKHLNISNLASVRDISCLYGLDLERMYCTMSNIPQEQQDEFKTLHPDCECEFGWVDPSKGHWRFIDGNSDNNVPENRVERYALLYEQIGYSDYANLSC